MSDSKSLYCSKNDALGVIAVEVDVVLRRSGVLGPHDPMRHDRARKNLDRHPNYIMAAYLASGT